MASEIEKIIKEAEEHIKKAEFNDALKKYQDALNKKKNKKFLSKIYIRISWLILSYPDELDNINPSYLFDQLDHLVKELENGTDGITDLLLDLFLLLDQTINQDIDVESKNKCKVFLVKIGLGYIPSRNTKYKNKTANELKRILIDTFISAIKSENCLSEIKNMVKDVKSYPIGLSLNEVHGLVEFAQSTENFSFKLMLYSLGVMTCRSKNQDDISFFPSSSRKPSYLASDMVAIIKELIITYLNQETFEEELQRVINVLSILKEPLDEEDRLRLNQKFKVLLNQEKINEFFSLATYYLSIDQQGLAKEEFFNIVEAYNSCLDEKFNSIHESFVVLFDDQEKLKFNDLVKHYKNGSVQINDGITQDNPGVKQKSVIRKFSDFEEVQKHKEKIKELECRAMQNDLPAMQQIISMTGEDTAENNGLDPEALLVRLRVLCVKGSYKSFTKSKKNLLENPFFYPTHEYLKNLLKLVRKAYELQIKQIDYQRPGIYADYARFFCEDSNIFLTKEEENLHNLKPENERLGEKRIFPKNLVLARRYFQQAIENNSGITVGDSAEYVKMCILGQGGVINLNEAQKILNKLIESDGELDYWRGQLDVLKFFESKDTQDLEAAEQHIKNAFENFLKSRCAGFEKSSIALEALAWPSYQGYQNINFSDEFQKIISELPNNNAFNDTSFVQQEDENEENYVDSDDEEQQKHVAGDASTTKSKQNTREIINCAKKAEYDGLEANDEENSQGSISKKLITTLDTLIFEASKTAPNKRKRSSQGVKTEKGIRSLFRMHYYQLRLPTSDHVISDLETLNYYTARDKLEEGLAKITTDFKLALTRGIHFHPKWTNAMIINYRNHVRGKNKRKERSLIGQAVFSQAVLTYAGVIRKPAYSLLETYKLQSADIYIKTKLYLLRKNKPHTEDDTIPTSAKGTLLIGKCTNRSYQIQQLYTGSYQGFHDYIEQESKTPDFFVTKDNPYVSATSVQVPHSALYALGSKMPKNYQREIIFDESLKIELPLGVVSLSLHPLEDLFNANITFSLHFKNEIFIRSDIYPERELTFISSFPENRVKFIQLAKLPSFSGEYKSIYLRRYGLEKKEYKKFKNLFELTENNKEIRQLGILLLTEYLALYWTLFLSYDAYERAKEENSVIIYPTKHGLFSLTPDTDISLNPNGHSAHHALRRLTNTKIYATTSNPSFFNSTLSSPAFFSGEHTQLNDRWYDSDKIIKILLEKTKNLENFYICQPMPQDAITLENVFLKAISKSDISFNDIFGASNYHLIIPINISNTHWVVLIICCDKSNNINITYFDSLGGSVHEAIKKTITDLYLNCCIFNEVINQVQFDGDNCGPWIITAVFSLINIGCLPDEEIDIEYYRQEYDEIFDHLINEDKSITHADSDNSFEESDSEQEHTKKFIRI